MSRVVDRALLCIEGCGRRWTSADDGLCDACFEDAKEWESRRAAYAAADGTPLPQLDGLDYDEAEVALGRSEDAC